MRKGEDPDPDPDRYLWLMGPDPGGPKTYGSCGSGSPTLDVEYVPTSSSGVVRVNVDGDVGMLLSDGVHKDSRSPRLQQPSHILREGKNKPTAENTEGFLPLDKAGTVPYLIITLQPFYNKTAPRPG